MEKKLCVFDSPKRTSLFESVKLTIWDMQHTTTAYRQIHFLFHYFVVQSILCHHIGAICSSHKAIEKSAKNKCFPGISYCFSNSEMIPNEARQTKRTYSLCRLGFV